MIVIGPCRTRLLVRTAKLDRTTKFPLAEQLLAETRRAKRGYTLLELLLALGLTVVVVSVIATAIQLYMVALTRQQAQIERKQIARAIIEMISSDIRAGVQYKAEDYSGLENLVKSIQLSVQPPPVEGEEPAEEEEQTVVNEEEVAFRPTLLGAEDVIMMDISRLPRLDQYNPLIAAEDLTVQSPSDVKSLAYFVALTEGGIEDTVDFAESNTPGGLYRREIDRAVAAYLGDVDLITGPDGFTRLIAREVAQIRFRYFDGEDWQTEWDSAEAGGFPRAVEISIVIDTQRTAGNGAATYNGPVEGETETYRSVVHLPVSDLPPAEE